MPCRRLDDSYIPPEQRGTQHVAAAPATAAAAAAVASVARRDGSVSWPRHLYTTDRCALLVSGVHVYAPVESSNSQQQQQQRRRRGGGGVGQEVDVACCDTAANNARLNNVGVRINHVISPDLGALS